ncbi:MAG TPA: TIGR04282 family arsenosugar biosynthesis glycosyltransferase [Burkholderiales bacterium]|nr:TIGR04282 family arsenosugar biosynthesis glycosyltransferase [Burkholderiales bacterium]
MKTVRIVIFAKAPIAGAVKTRLIPALGAQGAARLAHRMLTHTVAEAVAAGAGPVELCVSPSPIASVWQSVALSTNVSWSDQSHGDLGTRMARAVRRVTEAGESIVLIGTDCPQLDRSLLRAAASSLQHYDATISPTTDGGYVLLGLRRYDPALFRDIVWSTPTVASETLSRLTQLGWTVQHNPIVRDIDQPDDLAYLPPSWLDLQQAEHGS